MEERKRGNNVPFDDFRLVVEKRVTKIGHILAMMAPCEAPTYLTRAWCVFEAFIANENECKVTLGMASRDRNNFVNSIRGDNGADLVKDIFAALGSIDIRNAEAFVESDRTNIMRLIEGDAGYDNFNSKVGGLVRKWALDVIESEIRAGSRDLDDDYSKVRQGILLNNVAELFFRIHEVDRGLAIGKEGLRVNELVHGRESKHTAKSLYLVGCGTYYVERNKDEVAKEENESMAIYQRVPGQNDGNKIEWMMIIANMLRNNMTKDALVICEKVFEWEDTEMVESFNDLARVLQHEGELEEALKLYEEVIKIQEKVFGREHAKTAIILSNIANVLYRLDKKDEALELFKESFISFDKMLGSDHDLTGFSRDATARISLEIDCEI